MLMVVGSYYRASCVAIDELLSRRKLRRLIRAARTHIRTDARELNFEMQTLQQKIYKNISLSFELSLHA